MKKNMSSNISINTEDLDALQGTADYNSLRRELVAAGIASLFFGLIAIAAALVPAIWGSFFSAMWFTFGAFLLGEGIWLITGTPRPVGLIAHGLVMVIFSIWNIVAAGHLILILDPANPINKIAFQAIFILGIFQLIWGVQSIPRYGRFHRISIQKPSKENQRWFDQAADSISAAKPKDSKDIVVFMPSEPYARKLKGKLDGKVAIFVQGKGDDMFIAEKEHVNIVNLGNVTPGKSVRATLQIRNRKIKGKFPFQSFERYEIWKSSDKD
ncbi:hypothetical protein ACFLTN_06150 [Chloroflexota bacterium]